MLEALEPAGQMWFKLSLSPEGMLLEACLQCSRVRWGNLPGKFPAGAAPGGHPYQPASLSKPSCCCTRAAHLAMRSLAIVMPSAITRSPEPEQDGAAGS